MNTACFNDGSRLSWAQGLPLCGHKCVCGQGKAGAIIPKHQYPPPFESCGTDNSLMGRLLPSLNQLLSSCYGSASGDRLLWMLLHFSLYIIHAAKPLCTKKIKMMRFLTYGAQFPVSLT